MNRRLFMGGILTAVPAAALASVAAAQAAKVGECGPETNTVRVRAGGGQLSPELERRFAEAMRFISSRGSPRRAI